VVDRLGDVIVLLQQLGGVKRPDRIPPVPRPDGAVRPAEANGHREPPKMSTREEIRAFFGAVGGGTKVIVSPS
jgi:hypothetical protein